MRRKADRIQKIARDFAGQFRRWDGESDWTDELELRVEKLLRQEHRAVLRLAYKVYNWQVEQWADDEDAMHTFIEHLKQRAR